MKVLFVCSGNMVRSQIAEAYYNLLTQSHDASSAGVAATGRDTVSRRAIAVMNEVGISLDDHYSKQITPEMVVQADKIILFTVAEMPEYLAGSDKVEDWDILDLGFEIEDSIVLDRLVRDSVHEKVNELIGANNEHSD